MADWIVPVVLAFLGGSGIAGVITAWAMLRREGREQEHAGLERYWASFRDQIESARARGQHEEVERLRTRFEAEQEAWRAQQKVVNLAPREIHATDARPSLPGEQIEELVRLLAQSRLLSPALLSAQDHYLRGNAYYEAGEYEKALEEYSRSLELRPDDPGTLNNRGIALANLGRHKQALADFNRSLELRPDDPFTLLYNRGVALGHLGRNEEALADFNRSLELRPDDPDALAGRGITLDSLGRHDDALVAYTRSLALRPDHYSRACLFALWNKPDEAIEDLRRAIADDAKYREMARTESDFDNIRDDPRFRELVGEGEPSPQDDGSE